MYRVYVKHVDKKSNRVSISVEETGKNRYPKVMSLEEPPEVEQKLYLTSMTRDIKPDTSRVPSRLSGIPVIRTDADALYDLIGRKGEVKARVAAKHINVDFSTVERWGTILEKKGLAQIHFPAFGELMIRGIEWEKPKRNLSDILSSVVNL